MLSGQNSKNLQITSKLGAQTSQYSAQPKNGQHQKTVLSNGYANGYVLRPVLVIVHVLANTARLYAAAARIAGTGLDSMRKHDTTAQHTLQTQLDSTAAFTRPCSGASWRMAAIVMLGEARTL